MKEKALRMTRVGDLKTGRDRVLRGSRRQPEHNQSGLAPSFGLPERLNGELVKCVSAKSAKEEGMARVDANANEEFRSLMSALVRSVARSRKFFTSDHVFDLFLSIPGRPETHDYRAFGPVMLRAVKDGVCEKHNVAPISSNRRKLHASPRQVWKSLIYRRAAPSGASATCASWE